MGTRSLTVLMDGEDEIAVLYRQMDGYPEAHGALLAAYLQEAEVGNGIGLDQRTSRHFFNGAADLAVRLICHCKCELGESGKEWLKNTSAYDWPGSLYLHPAGTRDCGEDYVYYVDGGTVRAYRVHGFGETRAEEEIFKGTAAEMLEWIQGGAKSAEV